MRGRPLLYTSYESESAMLPTWTQRIALFVFLLLLVLLPLQVVPGLDFLGESDWLVVLNRVMIFALGALGLNILTGLAGQVSLGHAFFVGIGAYTAAILGGETGKSLWGLGLPMWIWLPAAGLAAALIGVIIAPVAVRVRGLYLAIVTLGLVFIGQHIFRNLRFITGGGSLGREFPEMQLRRWQEEEAIADFANDGPWFGIELLAEAKSYFFILVLLGLFAVMAKNISRTRLGRAFMAIRDRDVAAEIMGVAETRNKTYAFGVSSFYAGIAGALFASFFGRVIPEQFDLFMSVQFIAIILIGGAGTIIGVLLGSFFVIGLPRIVQDTTNFLETQAEEGGSFQWLADLIITTGQGDFGLISTSAGGPGLSVFQFNVVLYGLLIIVFLIFEPLGLYGIWLRIRNYFKAWPFSY